MARIGYKNAKYNTINATTNKYDTLSGSPATVPTIPRVIDEKFAPEYNSAELYADDMLAESDYSFKKGTLTITVADDDETLSAKFLGNTVSTETASAGEVTKNVSDTAKEIGYGHIVTKLVGGIKSWKVEFFPRVKITKVTTDAKTKGEGVEFGTTTLEGTVLPCDRAINGNAIGVWNLTKSFDTELAAVTYLNTCLTPST